MTSCASALNSVNNTRIINMDANIANKLNTLASLKSYKIAVNNSKIDLPKAFADIDEKYKTGRYISPAYPPEIPKDALMNASVDSYFFKRFIVYNGIKYECPTINTGNLCPYVGPVEKACCACGKNFACNPENIPGGRGCGANPSISLCNAPLSTNLFDRDITAEKDSVKNAIDRNLESLRNAWEISSKTILNKLEYPTINCCQEVITGDIDAEKVTFNDVGNKCNINGKIIE
jgi:hypothetical protein